MKSIWFSALIKDEPTIQKLVVQFKKYGLSLQGHFWHNDNSGMGWLAPKQELLKSEVGMWILIGAREDFEKSENRFGLAMLALVVQAGKGWNFPVILLQTEGDPISPDQLPTPLHHTLILPVEDPATPAKVVAKMHTPAKAQTDEPAYHINMVGNEKLGLWLEVYPVVDVWPGIIFGIDHGEIAFQAVGSPGRLPEKTTLNFPMQGLKLEMGGTNFSAWATQNILSAQNAYFIKINGTPGTLIFGPYSDAGEVDLHVLCLV